VPGWELAAREKAAIGKFPEHAWEIAVDGKGEQEEDPGARGTPGPRPDSRATVIPRT
jgi:hypothetical protein